MQKIFFLVFVLGFMSGLQAQQTLIPYNQKGKWGFCDISKTMIIQAQYDEARVFSTDSNLITKQVITFANVRKGNKWGVIDPTNNIIVPFEYNNVLEWDRQNAFFSCHNYNEKSPSFQMVSVTGKLLLSLKGNFLYRGFDGNGVAYAALNDKVGFINREGKILVPFQYEMWSPVTEYCYAEGLFGIGRNGKYGFVNAKNQVVIPFIFEHTPEAMGCFNQGKAHVMKGGKEVVINKQGKIIEIPAYKHIDNYPLEYHYIIATENKPEGLQVLLDKNTRKPVLAEKFNFIYPQQGFLEVFRQGKYGLLDAKTLQYVYPCTMTTMPQFLENQEGVSYWKIQDHQFYGILDKTGKIILPAVYENIYTDFSDKKPILVRKDKQYMLIDARGEILKKLPYHSINEYSISGKTQYFTGIDKSGRNGVFDIYGKEIVPCQYIEIRHFKNLSLAQKETSYKYIIIDSLGKDILQEEFESYQPFYESIASDYLTVTQNKKVGALNDKGKIIIPCLYEEILPTKIKGLFFVKENNLWGLRNEQKLLIKPKYDEILEASHEISEKMYLLVRKGASKNYIDLLGNEYMD
jgi:hypothetical protein